MMADIAREYAARYHDGQFRKKCGLPYIIHPRHVVQYLKAVGYDDETTLAIGWLHDTLEDTALGYDKVLAVFGMDVAVGVHLLTRDVGRDEYKRRLLCAPDHVKMVKLCDTLDNVRTLHALDAEGIERKVTDCQGYYIPMAMSLCPMIGERMQRYIQPYL